MKNPTPAPTVTSITQTGATWTNVTSKAATRTQAEIWKASNISGAGTVITVNLSGTLTVGGATASEFSGLDPSPIDKTASASGSGTAPVSGTTATTTEANEVWIASITNDNGGQSSPTNGFTLTTSASNAGYLEKIVSSTGTASTGVTTATSNWAGCIATFKAASVSTIDVDYMDAYEALAA